MVKWKWLFFSSRQGPLRLRKSGQRKRRRLGSKKLQGQQLVRAGERGAKQAESKDVKQFVKAVIVPSWTNATNQDSHGRWADQKRLNEFIVNSLGAWEGLGQKSMDAHRKSFVFVIGEQLQEASKLPAGYYVLINYFNPAVSALKQRDIHCLWCRGLKAST